MPTVFCDNPYHRGPDGGPEFTMDPEHGTSSTKVDVETAQALIEEHDCYYSPSLEDYNDASEASSEASSEGGDDGAPTEGDESDDETEGGGLEDEAAQALQAVDGIGPSYAEDLVGAGILTVRALAEADPEAVEEKAGLDADRVAGWVEYAQARLDSGAE